MKMKKLILTLAVLFATIGSAYATPAPLTAIITGDDEMNFYISTDNAVQGTLLASTTQWYMTSTLAAALTPGVTNYLHMTVHNTGGPGGLLAAFTLAQNSGFTFADGSTTLVSGDAGLTQNQTGFGSASFATVDEGGTTSGTWGNFSSSYNGLSPQWVWNYDSAGQNDNETLYFTAAINSTSAVPEPASIALMGLGLLALLALRKRQG